MFICTIVVEVANVCKTVYMQEYMNYTIVMLPFGLHKLQVYLHLASVNVYYCL